MKRLARVGIVVAVAAALVLTMLGTGSALATTVQCGDVLTHDTRVDNDLSCTGTALEVKGERIRLDLGGHTLLVTGPIADFHARAIAVDGANHVTIQNGTIRGPSYFSCFFGVRLNQASDVHIRDLEVDNCDYGIAIESSNAIAVEGNEVRNSGLAIWVASGFRPASDITVSHNVITSGQSWSTGIYLVNAYDSSLQGNEVSLMGSGIHVFGGLRNVVERNLLASNQVYGLDIRESSGTRVVRNRVTGNIDFPGGFESFDATDGIFVLNGPGTELLHNEASGNEGDGIDVLTPGVLLRSNTTNDNGDFGIEARLGVTDGGHNRASGNGNPAQCLNVSCR